MNVNLTTSLPQPVKFSGRKVDTYTPPKTVYLMVWVMDEVLLSVLRCQLSY